MARRALRPAASLSGPGPQLSHGRTHLAGNRPTPSSPGSRERETPASGWLAPAGGEPPILLRLLHDRGGAPLRGRAPAPPLLSRPLRVLLRPPSGSPGQPGGRGHEHVSPRLPQRSEASPQRLGPRTLRGRAREAGDRGRSPPGRDPQPGPRSFPPARRPAPGQAGSRSRCPRRAWCRCSSWASETAFSSRSVSNLAGPRAPPGVDGLRPRGRPGGPPWARWPRRGAGGGRALPECHPATRRRGEERRPRSRDRG